MPTDHVSAISTCFLNTPRDGDCTPSLGILWQCSTTLFEKRFPSISDLPKGPCSPAHVPHWLQDGHRFLHCPFSRSVGHMRPSVVSQGAVSCCPLAGLCFRKEVEALRLTAALHGLQLCLVLPIFCSKKPTPKDLFSTVHLLVLSSYWKWGLSWHLFPNWSSSQTTSIISHVQLFYPYAVAPGTVRFFSSLSLSFYHTFWTRRNEGEPANPHTSHLQQIQENKKPGMRETEVKGPAAEREQKEVGVGDTCGVTLWLFQYLLFC